MSHFATGVTIATARVDGIAHAMTATAVCAVSLEPALVLVCVGHRSRFHAAILRADGWAISVLADSQSPLARHFSSSGRRLETQFDDIEHHPAPYSGAPVLAGSLAWLDCRTHAVHDGGDHSIVVGQLLAAGPESAAAGPLTYYRGLYHEGVR